VNHFTISAKTANIEKIGKLSNPLGHLSKDFCYGRQHFKAGQKAFSRPPNPVSQNGDNSPEKTVFLDDF